VYKKNDLSFKRFCEQLGCPLLNPAWSWSALAKNHSRAIFTLWADQIQNGRYVFMSRKRGEPWASRNGAVELVRNFKYALAARSEVIGVLCYAEDLEGDPRKRKSFDQEVLLSLELAEEPDGFVAYVKGEILFDDAKSGDIRRKATKLQSAIDDLGDVPIGVNEPGRHESMNNGYRRDHLVREYVLRRANGKCEYCHQDGFVTRSGTPYLETHHIIALATNGPDTTHNVIALCPKHHREAHYGRDAEKLESDFLRIVAAKGR